MSKKGDRSNTEAYNKSPFVRLLSNEGRVQMLDVFLRKHYREMTVAEVIDLADISRSTFHRNIPELLELGIIETAGEVGGTQQYRVNTDNEIAKVLGQARRELIEYSDEVLDVVEKRDGKNLREIIEKQEENDPFDRGSSEVDSEIAQRIPKKV